MNTTADGLNSAAITASMPAPGHGLIVTTALIALLVSSSSFVLLATGKRHLLGVVNVLGTVVHEAGHALVACLTGGGVYRVQITSPDSGAVQSWYKSRFSSIATSAAGYAMPPLAGLGAAALLHHGHAPAVLTLSTTMAIVLLWVARDLVTASSLGVIGAITGSALVWGTTWHQNFIAYLESWLLLFSEIGGLAFLVANRARRRPSGQDDAANLARDTSIPDYIWIAAWFALVLWGVWTAFPLLWHR